MKIASLETPNPTVAMILFWSILKSNCNDKCSGYQVE